MARDKRPATQIGLCVQARSLYITHVEGYGEYEAELFSGLKERMKD